MPGQRPRHQLSPGQRAEENRMIKVASLSLSFLLAPGCGGGRGHAPIPSPDGSMTLHTRIEQSRDDPITVSVR
jgi:hypothetical protein